MDGEPKRETSGFCEAARQRVRDLAGFCRRLGLAKFEAPVAIGDGAFVRDKEVTAGMQHSTMCRRVGGEFVAGARKTECGERSCPEALPAKVPPKRDTGGRRSVVRAGRPATQGAGAAVAFVNVPVGGTGPSRWVERGRPTARSALPLLLSFASRIPLVIETATWPTISPGLSTRHFWRVPHFAPAA